jgi:heat shock protein HslJ
MSASQARLAITIFAVAIAVACSRAPSSETPGTPTDTAAKVAPSTDTTTSAAPKIRDTRWNLVALGNKQLAPADTQRATPHIILAPDSKQVSGSGGCNRMFGVYELTGDNLRFSGVGSTKMACKGGMDTETQFLGALLRVKTWKITGQQLELSDSTGALLAKFDAAK